MFPITKNLEPYKKNITTHAYYTSTLTFSLIMETNSNTSNDQSRLPSSSAPVMWHTNFTLGEDGSMVSIPNQEQPTTPEASSHGTDNIEVTVDGEKEQECESLSLLEERCAMLMEEHRQKKESLALELGVSLEEVEKRC